MGSFAISLSSDIFHEKVPSKNITRLAEISLHMHNLNGAPIFSGRAEKLPFVDPRTIMVTKPYWVVNGLVMEPTYLNALGNLVAIDGSYVQQDLVTMGHVSQMDTQMFIGEYPHIPYVPADAPWGINGERQCQGRWPTPHLADLAKKGPEGIFYFHDEVVNPDFYRKAFTLPPVLDLDNFKALSHSDRLGKPPLGKLKAAYRSAMRHYHPDRILQTGLTSKYAQSMTQMLTESYKALGGK